MQATGEQSPASPAGENKTVAIVITGLTETVAIYTFPAVNIACIDRWMHAWHWLLYNIIFDYSENWQLKLASYSYIRRSYVGWSN